MSTGFMLALRQLAMERNLSPEAVIQDLEAALAVAFRKESSFAPYSDLKVKVHPVSGGIRVLTPKRVVEVVTDPVKEISLLEAQRIKFDVKEGDEVEIEIATEKEVGRIAVQLAKQTLVHRLRKTEEITVYEEFQKYEGEVVSGVVQKVEQKQVLIDLGQAIGVLPSEEQIPGERYTVGQRLKFYVLKVRPSANKGFQIVLSRSHKNFLLRLFHLEVPEIAQGKVEIKAIAREAGSRSKVAVVAKEEGIDPIGSCIGVRGIRIQNIVKELNGEKVDVLLWDQDQAKFIANALSPASGQEVKLFPEEKRALVIIPDNQFTLAIGKDGQNAKLAAKLTGWRIDIKPSSLFREEVKVEPAPVKIEEVKVEPLIAPVEVVPAQALPERMPVETVPLKPGVEKVAVGTTPAKVAPKKEGFKTVDELLSSLQMLAQKKAELKPTEEPLPFRKEEEKKKTKKGFKPKKWSEEEEEDY